MQRRGSGGVPAPVLVDSLGGVDRRIYLRLMAQGQGRRAGGLGFGELGGEAQVGEKAYELCVGDERRRRSVPVLTLLRGCDGRYGLHLHAAVAAEYRIHLEDLLDACRPSFGSGGRGRLRRLAGQDRGPRERNFRAADEFDGVDTFPRRRRDMAPELRARAQGAHVANEVKARGRDDGREPINEGQRGPVKYLRIARPALDRPVEHTVCGRVVAQPLETHHRTETIAQEACEARPVLGADTDLGV